jgi:hypothetical protein
MICPKAFFWGNTPRHAPACPPVCTPNSGRARATSTLAAAIIAKHQASNRNRASGSNRAAKYIPNSVVTPTAMPRRKETSGSTDQRAETQHKPTSRTSGQFAAAICRICR